MIELLKNTFYYKDGSLYRIKTGKIAGTVRKDGYVQIKLNYKFYLAHRLIYLFHFNELPKFIDHIDGNPQNNRIENLREVNKSQNGQNAKKWKNNTSGVKGVDFVKKRNKWRVRIQFNGVAKHIGLFDDLELAELASQEARDKYHGQYARNS
jgi:hypothetical protein